MSRAVADILATTLLSNISTTVADKLATTATYYYEFEVVADILATTPATTMGLKL